MSNKNSWMSSGDKNAVRPSNEAKTKKNKAGRAEARAKGIPARIEPDKSNRALRRVGLVRAPLTQ